MDALDRDQTNRLLSALASRLALAHAHMEFVVIGGSALIALGLVDRTTRDVDVVAFLAGRALVLRSRCRLPSSTRGIRSPPISGSMSAGSTPAPRTSSNGDSPTASSSVSRARTYGSSLTVHFASRLDQIHLKLYALVDQGPGRHEADLLALSPSHEELLAAARWALTHDSSEGFRQELEAALRHLGVEDAGLGA